MRERKSADGAVANLVRSGRKQPQRFRPGSSASTFPSLRAKGGNPAILDCRGACARRNAGREALEPALMNDDESPGLGLDLPEEPQRPVSASPYRVLARKY